MWGAQGQTLALRAGNVMICGLGITECLLAASGGNGPGVADRSQARELAARARASRLPLRLPLADCLRPKG